jgi:signal peptidase
MTAWAPHLVLPVRLRRRILQATVTASASGALGLAIGLGVAMTWPVPFGGKALIEMSGSMSPTLEPGDIVVSRSISPLDAGVGDIVTFRDPTRDGRLISHRIRTIHVAGKRVSFATRGDANTTFERWSVDSSGRIGRVSYRIPKLGYALEWTNGRRGRLVLTVLLAGGLALLALCRIWRR